ncbi:MAG: hypothetical protein LBU14_00420 [Candidatus Peribacteria bacterium]|jgi:hypothetical protein|nr:hypothetical protein [Candidatus Peribacteria bacterium]
MSFKSFKEKVLDISIKAKNGIVNGTNKAVSFSSKGTVIKDRQILGKIIEKSKNTKFIDKKTQEEKITKKRVIIVFMNEKSEFFKRTLSSYPILAVRTFYQSVIMRLAISDIKDIDLKQYGIERFPSLVVFENTKPIKVIY